MTKTYCDICKEEKFILINYIGTEDEVTYNSADRSWKSEKIREICPSCKEKIEDFIKSITK